MSYSILFVVVLLFVTSSSSSIGKRYFLNIFFDRLCDIFIDCSSTVHRIKRQGYGRSIIGFGNGSPLLAALITYPGSGGYYGGSGGYGGFGYNGGGYGGNYGQSGFVKFSKCYTIYYLLDIFWHLF